MSSSHALSLFILSRSIALTESVSSAHDCLVIVRADASRLISLAVLDGRSQISFLQLLASTLMPSPHLSPMPLHRILSEPLGFRYLPWNLCQRRCEGRRRYCLETAARKCIHSCRSSRIRNLGRSSFRFSCAPRPPSQGWLTLSVLTVHPREPSLVDEEGSLHPGLDVARRPPSPRAASRSRHVLDPRGSHGGAQARPSLLVRSQVHGALHHPSSPPRNGRVRNGYARSTGEQTLSRMASIFS